VRPSFFTVGPTQLYPTVERHLRTALDEGIASISHRGRAYTEVHQATVANLRRLMSIPDDHAVFFLSSGTECMERVVQNCAVATSAHLVCGAFARRWSTTSRQLGKRTEDHVAPEGAGPDPEEVVFSSDAELVCMTQNETSTGVALAPATITAVARRHPRAVVAVDVVSCAPLVPFDWTDVDCTFFSVQKAFGLPAGLAVLTVSPRALERSREVARSVSTGAHHSFAELAKYAAKGQTPQTPNVLGIYLLGAVASDLLAVGLPAVRATVDRRAAELYRFFDRAGQTVYAPFVSTPRDRSVTTVVATVHGGSAPVLARLAKRGLVVSSGYDVHREAHLRIGNFPAHDDPDFARLLQGLEAAATA
jgi:phosphoserine aminotransferase